MDRNQQVLVELMSAAIRNTKPELEYSGYIDWESVMVEARNHRIESLLYPTIKKLDSEQIPEGDLLDRWKHTALIEGTRQVKHITRIRDVLKEFMNAKIRVIALKGLILRELYPYPELRTMSDADLFLHKENIESARKILITMGYKERKDPNDKHSVFDHKIFPRIELHWTFINFGIVVNDKSLENSVWQNAVPVYIGDVPVLSLSGEDHILFLILHMASHYISSNIFLRMFCDLVLLVESNINQIDWSYMIQKSEECHVNRFMRVVFMTCKMLFGLEVPDLLDCQALAEDPNLEEFQNDVFASENYGSSIFTRQMVGSQLRCVKRDKPQNIPGKLSILISFIFPSANKLEFRFHYARKYHILYLIAWLHRTFRGLVIKKIPLGEKWQLLSYSSSFAQKRSNLLQWLDLW